MNFKKILYTALFAAGCLSASAQTTQTVETFNHHWFIQAQGGAQYTLGEVSFDKLISPNAQIAAGYQFTPVWGLRLSVNGWQSKGGSKTTLGRKYWKWNYVSPTVDATMDLTNLLGGYKKRLVSVGLLAGLGANIGWEMTKPIVSSQQVLWAILWVTMLHICAICGTAPRCVSLVVPVSL